ncbi:MAG: hypothetical protein RIT81_39690 [Deltaproteobacteria bacterium]
MLYALALGALISACPAKPNTMREGTQMSKHEDRIKSEAAQQMSWNAGDVVVETIDAIELGGCHFYGAFHATKPTGAPLAYAVLANGEVVGQAKQDAVDAIAAGCRTDGASAKSWAELLARFDTKVAPGQVLYAPPPPISEGDAPDARIQAPKLDNGTLTFFTHNMHTDRTYVVTAKVSDGAVSDVEAKNHN